MFAFFWFSNWYVLFTQNPNQVLPESTTEMCILSWYKLKLFLFLLFYDFWHSTDIFRFCYRSQTTKYYLEFIKGDGVGGWGGGVGGEYSKLVGEKKWKSLFQ